MEAERDRLRTDARVSALAMAQDGKVIQSLRKQVKELRQALTKTQELCRAIAKQKCSSDPEALLLRIERDQAEEQESGLADDVRSLRLRVKSLEAQRDHLRRMAEGWKNRGR